MNLKRLKNNYQGNKSFIASWPVKNCDKEYENVLKVLHKFEMKTTKDYHDLHLKCEVLFLTDVLGKFIKISLTNCGLCPSHYLRSPALI